MKRSPVILVMPSTESKGAEFADYSVSVSNRYTDAIIAVGGLPHIFPATTNQSVIEQSIESCDGVLLTGGDDIDPKLYGKSLSPELAAKLGPLEPERDVWEREIIAKAMAHKKPMLGVCRGHQMLNVALGGTLVVDIATELPNALNHRQMDRKSEAVQEIDVESGSILAQLTGQKRLSVNSTHHQAIEKVAPTLRPVAKTSDGIIEAVEWKEPAGQPFLLSVQFHPERLIDSNRVFLQLFSGFVEACARQREIRI